MDEREITHYFIVTNQLHRRMVESNLEGMRIHRAQHRLLMTLSCKRSYSQVEIAKELEVSPATIAVALKNLEKEQYIVRTSKMSFSLKRARNWWRTAENISIWWILRCIRASLNRKRNSS